jgi:hypothetical protein
MRSLRGFGVRVVLVGLVLLTREACPQTAGLEDLARLSAGRTRAENALWIENPLTARFNTSKRVVVADLKGPGEVTMIHFALPQSHFGQPIKLLNRDLLLRAYWDGEATPSVDVPLVDFFCDPNGFRESVNTAVVNKRRGFNAYFPMPYRRSAKIELIYDGPVAPGDGLWRLMPCYSYVCYHMVKKVPRHAGYFHAAWRQESLLLGQRDYEAAALRGKGKMVGWNVTVHALRGGYPVDENEKFYIDGEPAASIEFQGLEDSFGFSWGFPETENLFPLTGYFKYLHGAAAYRFFLSDSIHFEKSLRVAIGFGVNEDPSFRKQFSRPGSTLEFSSTLYWYQTEPHAPLPAIPPAAERAPAAEAPRKPEKETLPRADELKARGVKLEMRCGRPHQEIIYAENDYDATVKQGFAWSGWEVPIYYARADKEAVEIELTVPKGAAGTLRVFVIDPDDFGGGRKEKLEIAGEQVGPLEDFQDGKWIERPVNAIATGSGKLLVRAINARQGSNAVISILEWVENSAGPSSTRP